MASSKSARARNSSSSARASAARASTGKTSAAKTSAGRTIAVKADAKPIRSGPTGGSRAAEVRRRSAPVPPSDASETAAPTGPPAWLQLSTLVLALGGLGVSIYLTIAHYTESALLGCSEKGLVNCTKVTTSPQSIVFGIPVAVLGLAFYLFIVPMMSPWVWRSTRREVAWARLGSLVVGIGFVLYLVYAELFEIDNICLYCTSVHVITFLLFVLTVLAAAVWGLGGGIGGTSSDGRQQ
jgi:uncharacterized membrane protein